MKQCSCCGEVNRSGAETCTACGEASWDPVFEVPGPEPMLVPIEQPQPSPPRKRK